MAKIITISAQKGGVGKSLIALNLSYAFQNIKVGLLDIDPQGSITLLNPENENLKLINRDNDIYNLKLLPFDLVIIDTPPYLSSTLPNIFKQSDLVIIPTKTGFFDVLAINSTIELLKKAMSLNPSLKGAVLFNMVKPQSGIISEIRDLIIGFDIPLFRSQLTDRVSYTRSTINGGIFKSNDNKAIKEMLNLCEEVIKLLNL